jgi:UV excision repair protein RAD23
MKIIVKSLKQISYEIDIMDASMTVETFKKEIENKHSFDSKSIKLLYNGVILEDNKLLSDYKIDNEHVLMMITSKIKPINVNKEEEKKEQPVLEVKPIEKKEVKEPKVIPIKSYDNEITNMVEMGFTKDQATSAINAAKGNLNLAIDYLYNGIPASQGVNPQLNEFLDEDEEEEYEAGAILDDLLSPEVLSHLDLNNPDNIKIIASVVKIITSQDSSQLPDILADIEETNPEIIEFIKKHEAKFREELEKPLNEQDIACFTNLGGDIHDEGSHIEGGHVEGLEHMEHPDLTNTDNEVIERLKALGFSDAECIEAYFACDKNETMAANLLFENKYKEDMDVDCNIKFNIDDESELSQSSKKDNKK